MADTSISFADLAPEIHYIIASNLNHGDAVNVEKAYGFKEGEYFNPERLYADKMKRVQRLLRRWQAAVTIQRTWRGTFERELEHLMDNRFFLYAGTPSGLRPWMWAYELDNVELVRCFMGRFLRFNRCV